MGPLADPASFGGDPADAFDVIVPSLPGFGFSTPINRPASTSGRCPTSGRLMTDVLGYERFGADGCDMGGFVTASSGTIRRPSDRNHVTGRRASTVGGSMATMCRGAGVSSRSLGETDRTRLFSPTRRSPPANGSGSVTSLSIRPTRRPSPMGSMTRRSVWRPGSCNDASRGATATAISDPDFTKDDLLTTSMIYWATDTLWSSIRYYYEAVDNPWRPSHDRSPVVEYPTGFSPYLPDRFPGTRNNMATFSADYNVNFVRVHESGGHFVPMEEPDTLIADLRDFFRPLRASL